MKMTFSKSFQRWEASVGKSIMYFGDIELVTFFCLSTLLTESIHKTTSKLPFRKRVSIILELLESIELEEKIKSEFISLLNEAVNLSGTRNIIAHNPLQMSVFANNEGEIKIRPEIKKYLTNNVKVDLGALETFANRVQELAFELHETHQKIAKQLKKETAF